MLYVAMFLHFYLFFILIYGTFCSLSLPLLIRHFGWFMNNAAKAILILVSLEKSVQICTGMQIILKSTTMFTT